MCSFHSVLTGKPYRMASSVFPSFQVGVGEATDFSDEVVEWKLEQSNLSCLLDIASMLYPYHIPALSSLKQIYMVFNFKDCPGTVDVNQSLVL